jgi:drug/metabolite transporter (DMT)-like permease
MRRADILRLFTLAAIWGFSFLFMRIVAPVMGPLWTVEVRVALAGVAMLAFLAMTGRGLDWRANWQAYLILGLSNSALPFALFSYAALTIPAGYSAIMNATSPLWGALIGALAFKEKLSARKFAGLLIGVTGVACLVRLGPVQFTTEVALAAGACALAALCYAIAGVYSKKAALKIPSAMMATGSQLGGALLILPFLPLSPMRAEVTPFVALIAVLLAIFCSAVAYFIYFRLMADVGPTKALTVTFLVPMFALGWGALFLGETINGVTLLGCGMVVLATWLVAFSRAKPLLKV